MKVLRQSKFLKVILTIVGSMIISFVISFISERINILEKFTIAITDVDFTDLYYQYWPKPKPDENIVIVNIGYKNRSELAEIIRTISNNKPKIIGGDVFFDQSFDTLDVVGTDQLVKEVSSINNIVLASAYNETDEGLGSIAGQSPLIKGFIKEGVVNLNIATDDPEYGTVRSFKPITDVNGVKHLSFGFLVASFLDSSIIQFANEDEMMIRWYGYGDRNSNSLRIFKTFDWHQIQNDEFVKKDFEGKIVLLGFMGETIGDYVPEDIFFSPLNRKIIGRSLSDMYGVEIHANIIKMIIDRDFIYHSKAADFLFNLLFVAIFTVVLFWVQSKYPNQYSILSKMALILFVDLLILGAIGIFSVTTGSVKFLIADGLFVMLFLPDTYEFLDNNVFKRLR